jgi:hypothetical protein
MNVFEKSKWIWATDTPADDEYGEFYSEFTVDDEKKVTIRISVDGDYALFINGSYAASNQYGDFEHYKVYDELDITKHTKKGSNKISVLAWHHGENSSRYRKAAAGLIFEVICGIKIVANSSKETLCRISPAYESHRCKKITPQLGFGFHYDASKNDELFYTGTSFNNSFVVKKDCIFYKLPQRKLELSSPKIAVKTDKSEGGRHYLIDLGEECVGLLTFKFHSNSIQKICIAWGEHLVDSHVPKNIGIRDFSIEYTARSGDNAYTNYMLRFGARYIEIFAEEEISLEYATIIPEYYPAIGIDKFPEDELDRRIYKACRKTLQLSMLEHYVDCPWREQALYAFDSRNQMLCGYYTFENKNSEYAKANLKLISMDRHPDTKLLSICYPCGIKTRIPSFSLHYITAVLEYYEHTGDLELLKEVYPKLEELISVFKANKKDGLVCQFPDKNDWNFYDWSEYLDGAARGIENPQPDSIINFLYIIALEKFEKISHIVGKKLNLSGEIEELRCLVRKKFFNGDDGLFSFYSESTDYTELAGALAIISGTVNGDTAKQICEKILSGRTTESSLSLKCFLYDALLIADSSYKDTVLKEIRHNYKYMLDNGADTVWETIKGAADFDGAGSLCHGWSAIPIYYYHKFGLV